MPGHGSQPCGPFLELLADRGFDGPHRGGDQHPQGRHPRGARGRPARGARVQPAALRRVRRLSRGSSGHPRRPDRCDTARVTDRSSAGRGRRPGAPDTRAEILGAARSLFAARGFAGTSVRAIAAEAGVDPALVHHYFGTKDDLFVAALQLPVDPRELLAPGPRGRRRTARRSGCCASSSAVWDDPENQLAAARAGPQRGGARRGAGCSAEGFVPVVLGPVGRGARHRPARAADAPGGQPDDRADHVPLRARGSSRWPRWTARCWWRRTPRRCSATSPASSRSDPLTSGPAVDNSSHDE